MSPQLMGKEVAAHLTFQHAIAITSSDLRFFLPLLMRHPKLVNFPLANFF